MALRAADLMTARALVFALVAGAAQLSVGAGGELRAPDTFEALADAQQPDGQPGIDMDCFDRSCGDKLARLRSKDPQAAAAWDCMRYTPDVTSCIAGKNMDAMPAPERKLFMCAGANLCIKGLPAEPRSSFEEVGAPPGFDVSALPDGLGADIADFLPNGALSPATSFSEDENGPSTEEMKHVMSKGLADVGRRFDRFEQTVASHIKELKETEKHAGELTKSAGDAAVEARKRAEMTSDAGQLPEDVPEAFRRDDPLSFIQTGAAMDGDVPFSGLASWLEGSAATSRARPSSLLQQDSPGSLAQTKESAQRWAAIDAADHTAADVIAKLDKQVQADKASDAHFRASSFLQRGEGESVLLTDGRADSAVAQAEEIRKRGWERIHKEDAAVHAALRDLQAEVREEAADSKKDQADRSIAGVVNAPTLRTTDTA